MKAYFLLLRLNMQNMLATMKGGFRKPNGKLDVSRIVLYPLVVLGVLSLCGMVVAFEYIMFEAFQIMGQPALLSGIILLLTMISTLLFSVFHMLSSLYFGRDTASMAYLPVTSRTVLAAKWTQVYIGELFLSLLIATPALILYGISYAPDWSYYLRMVAVLLTVNCIPLAISLLLSAILGHFTALTKNKELWIVLGTVLALVVVYGLEWTILPKIPEDAGAMFFAQVLLDATPFLERFVGAFPPVKWALRGLQGDWLLWALYLLVSVGAVVLCIGLVGGDYLQTTLRQSEGTRTGKRVRITDKTFRSRNVFAAMYFREWNEILHVPIYLLNGVLGVLLLPIMLTAICVSLSSEGQQVMELLEMMQQGLNQWDMMLVLTATLVFISWLNPLVSTAVSREGRRMPIAKFIPMPAKVQLFAKLSVNLTINFVAIAIMGVAMVVLLGWKYLLPVLGAVVLGNLFSLASGCVAITMDACRPVLTWKSEREVMKQNMNTMIAMALTTLLALLPIGAVVGTAMLGANAEKAIAPNALQLFLTTHVSEVCAVAVVLTMGLETALSVLLMCKVGVKRFMEIEP